MALSNLSVKPNDSSSIPTLKRQKWLNTITLLNNDVTIQMDTHNRDYKASIPIDSFQMHLVPNTKLLKSGINQWVYPTGFLVCPV